MTPLKEKLLPVKAQLIKDGIKITVNGKNFSINYPQEIWDKTPEAYRLLMLENLTYGDTHFLPITLGYDGAEYNTNFPIFESVIYRNQMMDMTKSEQFDNAPHLSYVKQLHNITYKFGRGKSSLPTPLHKAKQSKNKQPVAVIPFTFGKESLTTFALCREMGIKPVLVYSQEPSMVYEEAYKKKKLVEFAKKFDVDTYFVTNGPGAFRYDAAFQKKRGTEVGWGAQTTLITLQVLPFVLAYNADYLLFGSEYANNEVQMFKGWKVFVSADQTSFFTMEQDAMMRLLTGGQCEVRSSLEAIEETAIFYLLHTRYPEIGKYQFSCTAEYPLERGSQWCHRCYKCSRMFVIARACGIDPLSIGFKRDILQDPGLFNHYFGKEHKTGSADELDFCFYAAMKRGVTSPYITLFKKQKLAKAKPWATYVNMFTELMPAVNLPSAYEKKMLSIFADALKKLKKNLPA